MGQGATNKRKDHDLVYSLFRDVFTRLYYTTLLGGEFGNCHGQGNTPEGAVMSLRIRVNQLRNKRKGSNVLGR